MVEDTGKAEAEGVDWEAVWEEAVEDWGVAEMEEEDSVEVDWGAGDSAEAADSVVVDSEGVETEVADSVVAVAADSEEADSVAEVD